MAYDENANKMSSRKKADQLLTELSKNEPLDVQGGWLGDFFCDWPCCLHPSRYVLLSHARVGSKDIKYLCSKHYKDWNERKLLP